MDKDIEELSPVDILNMPHDELVQVALNFRSRLYCVRGQLTITAGYLELAERDKKTATH